MAVRPPARRFIAVRDRVTPILIARDPANDGAGTCRSSIDANLNFLHAQQQAFQAVQLRQTLTKAPETGKAAATRALDDDYDT